MKRRSALDGLLGISLPAHIRNDGIKRISRKKGSKQAPIKIMARLRTRRVGLQVTESHVRSCSPDWTGAISYSTSQFIKRAGSCNQSLKMFLASCSSQERISTGMLPHQRVLVHYVVYILNLEKKSFCWNFFHEYIITTSSRQCSL